MRGLEADDAGGMLRTTVCIRLAAYPVNDDTSRGTLLNTLVLLKLCIFCAIGDPLRGNRNFTA